MSESMGGGRARLALLELGRQQIALRPSTIKSHALLFFFSIRKGVNLIHMGLPTERKQ